MQTWPRGGSLASMMQPALRISRAVKQAIREAAGYSANTSAAVALSARNADSAWLLKAPSENTGFPSISNASSDGLIPHIMTASSAIDGSSFGAAITRGTYEYQASQRTRVRNTDSSMGAAASCTGVPFSNVT